MSGFPPPSPEQPLSGGNMGEVARVGDTVRRRAGAWTPTIHRLLAHVRRSGIDWAPEPRGVDDSGREVLSYTPGSVHNYPMPAEVWADETLRTAGRMLRALHDATLDFDTTAAIWQQPAHAPVEVICHNDFAPYNMVFVGAELSAVIDWDTASPGSRLWDLSYLAYRLAPLCSEPGTPELDVHARLALLLESYGSSATVSELLTATAERLDDLAVFTEEQASLQGRHDLLEHAALYRADAAAIRST